MLYFNNLLIISDNKIIVKRLLTLLENLGISKSISCEVRISKESIGSGIGNLLNRDEKELVINVKNKIDYIISNFDLVISAHCKQLFPADLVKQIKCINIHPGYNPINRGWYPQVFSIINKLDLGATIHEIDEELDHGDIIARKKIKIESWDTSRTLHEKIIECEFDLLEKYLIPILKNDYKTIKPENQGNLFWKKDFTNLLNIDLNEKLTMGEAIDKLRAITHEPFRNAYFYDNEKNKVFVSIKLEKE